MDQETREEHFGDWYISEPINPPSVPKDACFQSSKINTDNESLPPVSKTSQAPLVRECFVGTHITPPDDAEEVLGQFLEKSQIGPAAITIHCQCHSHSSQLIALKKVAVIPPRPLSNPLPKWHNPTARCEFRSGGIGHDTDNCYNLMHRVQDLIDQSWYSRLRRNPMLSKIPFLLMRSEVAALLLQQIGLIVKDGTLILPSSSLPHKGKFVSTHWKKIRFLMLT